MTTASEPRAAERAQRWERFLGELQEFAGTQQELAVSGTLVRVTGLVLEAAGVRAPVGSVCEVIGDGHPPVTAEVVGFNGNRAFLMPTGMVQGLSSGARVMPRALPCQPPRFGQPQHPWRRTEDRGLHLPMGDGLLGRVIDAMGQPMDGLGPLAGVRDEPMNRRPINAMDRDPIRQPLDTGVRAINSLLTVGRGQRIGLFAGTGVGKSVLLGMMARYTEADVIVVGLIGERGREVKEFIEQSLGPEGLARSVVVAAPADTSPLMRMQGAAYATTVAEYFRDQGKQVLLIMDSLTRYAMAQREIALAIGEPPVTRGYPPSVFARLPALVERAGNGPEGGGSITAFYTVLAEGDDQQDPIADSARAILDGHFVLSRSLADQGHYPAIDIEQSISRAMHNLVGDDHFNVVRQFKQFFSRYQRSRDLIAVGAYQPGGDPLLDMAVKLYPKLEAFLQQGIQEHETYEGALQKLAQVFS